METSLLLSTKTASDRASTDSISVLLGDGDDPDERESVGGCSCTPPPCLYSSAFRMICETSICCRTIIGPIGYKRFERNRAKVFFFAGLASLLAVLFQLISVIALSRDANIIADVPWAYGSEVILNSSNQEIKVFMGIRALLFQNVIDGEVVDETVTNWADVGCVGDDNLTTVSCDSCTEFSSDFVLIAIVSLITSVPQLSTDITRSTRHMDVNCQKAFGIFTGILSCLTTLSALVAFNSGCFDDVNGASLVVPPEIIEGEEVIIAINWNLSVSFYTLLFATLLKPVDVMCHLLVPTPKFVQNGQPSLGGRLTY